MTKNISYITTIKAQSSEERPLTLNFENYSIKYFCKFGLPKGGIVYKILYGPSSEDELCPSYKYGL